MDKLIFKEIKNYKKVVKNIREDLTKYITSNDIKSLVLGVSGGLDSAVVAALARPVCDKLGIPLNGWSLPSDTNKSDEIVRAKNIGSCFCNNFTEYSIQALFEEYSKRCHCVPKDKLKVFLGNVKARLRMIILYGQAQVTDGMVLGTDNLTEYLLGFWTLHGDVGDYSPIQFLWKSEVYELAKHMARNEEHNMGTRAKEALIECINAVPTDGLGITSSDMESIAGDGTVTYQTIDVALKMVLKGKSKGFPTVQSVYERILRRHQTTHYKRNNPYNITRKQLLAR